MTASRSSIAQFSLHLAQRLQQWKDNGLERSPGEFCTSQGPWATIDGRDFLLFSSSNYLGLSTHPRVLAASQNVLQHYGAGSGGSRLTTGTTQLHRAVERYISDWLGYESTTYFATGYQANVGVLSTVADENTTIISDERNHASIIDGTRLARAQKAIYPHRDLVALAECLQTRTTPFALVVSDGLFSMDGTISPVQEMARVAHDNGAMLLIDEAHSIGTIGATGRGCVENVEGDERPDILVGTASKALGSEGGFVCASETIGQLLKNQARPYVYSTSNSAAVMAATLESLRVLREEPQLVARLQSNAERLRQGLRNLHLETSGDGGPIIPVWIGAEDAAMQLSQELKKRGFFVPAIRYPTVPRGRAMLRITVMATHSAHHIEMLLAALKDLATA